MENLSKHPGDSFKDLTQSEDHCQKGAVSKTIVPVPSMFCFSLFSSVLGDAEAAKRGMKEEREGGEKEEEERGKRRNEASVDFRVQILL